MWESPPWRWVEGTGELALRRAAGHITGTGLPGQPGNIGIAGHRDTFFRPLRKIQRDDIITLTTARGQFRYRVVSMNVVSPNDVAVLNPNGHEILTLVTCYPFYFTWVRRPTDSSFLRARKNHPDIRNDRFADARDSGMLLQRHRVRTEPRR